MTQLATSNPYILPGFGWAVGFSIGLSFLIGALTYFLVQGEAENYFVAGKSLPLWIVAMTLGAQSVDSNSLLGNVDLSYKFHFFDGAVIPIGLGLSLILNGLLLAGKINAEEGVLTLPDVLSRRYGKVVEVLVGLISITSFLMLLAGNLVGMGIICSYVWGINESLSIWLCAVIVWTYTVTGGLFSVAYTDVVQGAVGWYVHACNPCRRVDIHTHTIHSRSLVSHTNSPPYQSLANAQVWLYHLLLLAHCQRRTRLSATVHWIPRLCLPRPRNVRPLRWSRL